MNIDIQIVLPNASMKLSGDPSEITKAIEMFAASLAAEVKKPTNAMDEFLAEKLAKFEAMQTQIANDLTQVERRLEAIAQGTGIE